MKQKNLHVFLGRFSPIHKGHQIIINKLIAKFGIENCLIIIGSSTSLNPRTPFTYNARKKMVKTLYPKIKIIGISDIDNKIEFFDPINSENWLGQLKIIESKFTRKFIFYGGSRNDIELFRMKFKAYVFVNRYKDGLDISATKIRDGLIKKDHSTLHKYLDENIIDTAIVEFKKFQLSSN